ncbi:hypothetical protein VL15_08855 [Burkholderia cepacia]|uniref:TPM domain-containing protein n=1 Tax=Burkholderia cepacia TaxID=292 RepID=A0A0J5X964_BURCE|nr:TPM domain-containing protein [Burkholderia cepacia]KML60488.1 hypothetical protein VL15_08855 [Burkholderia cepacia]
MLVLASLAIATSLTTANATATNSPSTASGVTAKPSPDVCTHAGMAGIAPVIESKDGIPILQGRVTDTGDVLTESCKAYLTGRLDDLERTTSVQLAVLVVPSIGQNSIEQFASTVFEKWKLGQRNVDNGILLVAAIQDRRVRIEVGYGLEGTLPDVVVGEIIHDRIVPAFRAGKIETGLSLAVDALANRLASPLPESASGLKDGRKPASNESSPLPGDSFSLWLGLANIVAGIAAARYWPRWPTVLSSSYALTVLAMIVVLLLDPMELDMVGTVLLVFMVSALMGPLACLLGWGLQTCIARCIGFFRNDGIRKSWSSVVEVYQGSVLIHRGIAIAGVTLLVLFLLGLAVGLSVEDTLILIGLLVLGVLLICLYLFATFAGNSSSTSSSTGRSSSSSGSPASDTFSGRGGSSGGGGASGNW